MLSMLRNAVVFLWLSAVSGSAQSIPHDDTYSTSRTTQTPSVTSSAPVWTSVGLLSLNSTGTCPSRTVNFITHTLAQQCLRTDRASSSATQSALPDVTDNTGAFATTITSDQQPQVVIVTYTVANGSTIAIAEHGGSAREQVSTQSSSIPEASPVTDSPAAPAPSIEEEVDSALDNANFLSFEDWKRQNLAKSGQNPEDVGRSQNNGPPRPRPVNNVLDTLGDDQEIDIDFAGFGAASQPRMPDRTNSATETAPSDNPTSLRSKDAGKTCKERTNYASFDCAATVLKSNKEAKSVTSVLIESKDSYMLNKCSAENKFFIVELCNDIQIDTVVLANYEFFSSGFRHFKLSVSDRYPVKMEKWRDLGTFEARNTREIQAFLVENPQIWARYLRIEFLTHYGSEYYCPVSLLRVHGITMMEDYRHQEELASGEIDDVALEAEALATPPIYQEPAELTDETSKATEQAVPPVVEVEPEAASADANTIEEVPTSDPMSPTETIEPSRAAAAESSKTVDYSNDSSPMQVGLYEPANANMTCDLPATSDVAASSSAAASRAASAVTQGPVTDTSASTSIVSNSSSAASSISTTMESTSTEVVGESSVQPAASSTHHEETPQSVTGINSSSSSTILAAASVNTSINANQTASGMTNSTRTAASSASSPPPPQPSTQESFFKSVHKRLQQLESNSTLSLQYIEEQSRILREAFSKVEKRQVSTTSRFLTQLNETVMVELQGFRQAYDQLWQSTVIELEGQRETYQREMLALSSRLTMVADELVWQKRVGIVQSTLLLMCLVLVLFGRSSNGGLEMPLMQQLLNKSTTALSGWESPPNSPGSLSPVSLFRRKLWRSNTAPADTQYHRDNGGPGPCEEQEEAEVEINLETPSSPSRNDHDEWEDEDRSPGDSPEYTRQTSDHVAHTSSPGRRRRKQKKSSGYIAGSTRFAGGESGIGPARAKSPSAHGTWVE